MIRDATANDLSMIQEIAKAAYTPFVAEIGKKPAPMVANFAAQIDDGLIEVSTDEIRVQGFCVSYPEGTVWHVENLAVSPSAQGNGIGRALLASAEKQAREWGFDAVELYTNIAMTGALALYPRLGYVELYRQEQDGFHRAFFKKSLA